jgi:hypothetical protein
MKSLATAGLALSLLIAAPGGALAEVGSDSTTNDTAPTGDTAPTPDGPTPEPDGAVTQSSTINVLGTGISLDVELDDTGRLAAVALVEQPADDGGDGNGDSGDGVPPGDDEPTGDGDGDGDGDGGPLNGAEVAHRSGHKVRIVLDDEGTSLEVQAGGNKVDTRVRTSGLDRLIGEHTWSGELFGDGGGLTTVRFTVGGDGDEPAITSYTVEPDGGYSARVSSEDGGTEAKLRIDFASDDPTNKPRVVISVSIDDDEGEGEGDSGPTARLRISVHSKLLASANPRGPADDPDLEIDGEDVDGSSERGRSEDKRRDDKGRETREPKESKAESKGRDRDGADDDKSGKGQGGGKSDDDSGDDSDDGEDDD